MIAHYDKNPNSVAWMDNHYSRAKFSPENERLNAWMFPLLEKYIPKEGTVLEVGCGCGRTLDWIYQKNPNLKLIGTDVSNVAIQKGAEYYKHIEFICEDAEFAEHKDIDLVICSQTLEHVDRPSEVMINMQSWLKDKGVLFITIPYPRSVLDMGCKVHYWSIYEHDFISIFGKNVICSKIDKNHLAAIWEKK